jgi:hypothetical protein
LIFLMDLSIKNRIDRFKGVGDLAWANDIYVMATINGFFEGLFQKAKNIIPKQLPEYFGIYLASLTEMQSIENFLTIFF